MDLPPLPPTAIVQPSTQHVSLAFTFDFVPGATWYYVKVKTNGVEALRRYSMTNFVVVSNLSVYLDQYTFTAVATNTIGESDESPPAPQHLVIVQDGTNVLTVQPTNQTQTYTNLHPMTIRQWNSSQEMKKD